MFKNPISELSEEQLDKLLAYTPEFSEKNLENIKRLSLEKMSAKPTKERKFAMKKIFVIAAAVALFLITSSAIFAASGGLEGFLARFNTNFGEFAIPPLYPAYAEYNGIRIEAVGAQQIDHVVLVYLSMQDVSGENRLTQDMWPDLEIYVDGEVMSRGGRSAKRLDFNHNTNTVYYEMIIQGTPGMPKADSIEIRSDRIECFGDSLGTGQIVAAFEGEWSFFVNTSDLGIVPIVWENVSTENLQIERMSLSPFGVQINGNHTYGRDFPFLDIRIEFENRLFNTRIRQGGGGWSPDCFSHFGAANSPINIDDVSAVIIQGDRFPRP